MELAADAHNVMIVGRFGEGNGNNTTATRIKKYLLDSGYNCQLVEADSFASITALSQYILQNDIKSVIGIHGYRAGKLLRGISVPYCLIFGGTDVNEYCNNKVTKAVISEALENARMLVAFSQAMADRAISQWPVISSKTLLVIPQGVSTEPSVVKDSSQWKVEHGIPESGYLFTLVAGLRPVKDPLYLVKAFSKWQRNKRHTAWFIVVGPQMDVEFSATVMDTILGLPGVVYVGSMSLADTHRLMAESFAVVNSSLSEGMSTAILEAMDLGVPVVARNIEGNAAVIDNMKTGLLFDSPQEFIEQCEMLIDDLNLRETLACNARNYVKTNHSTDLEKQKYSWIVGQLSPT